MLTLAEQGLDTAMRELAGSAEKTMIAKVLSDAFEKVRAARQEVADVEKLLDEPG